MVSIDSAQLLSHTCVSRPPVRCGSDMGTCHSWGLRTRQTSLPGLPQSLPPSQEQPAPPLGAHRPAGTPALTPHHDCLQIASCLSPCSLLPVCPNFPPAGSILSTQSVLTKHSQRELTSPVPRHDCIRTRKAFSTGSDPSRPVETPQGAASWEHVPGPAGGSASLPLEHAGEGREGGRHARVGPKTKQEGAEKGCVPSICHSGCCCGDFQLSMTVVMTAFQIICFYFVPRTEAFDIQILFFIIYNHMRPTCHSYRPHPQAG